MVHRRTRRKLLRQPLEIRMPGGALAGSRLLDQQVVMVEPNALRDGLASRSSQSATHRAGKSASDRKMVDKAPSCTNRVASSMSGVR